MGDRNIALIEGGESEEKEDDDEEEEEEKKDEEEEQEEEDTNRGRGVGTRPLSLKRSGRGGLVGQ